jgi:hypothetical protein
MIFIFLNFPPVSFPGHVDDALPVTWSRVLLPASSSLRRRCSLPVIWSRVPLPASSSLRRRCSLRVIWSRVPLPASSSPR